MTEVFVRKLRHWKQRFDKNAQFIWTRPKFYGGQGYSAGDPIPEHLANNKAKLKRFWESRVIELAEFGRPNVITGIVPPKDPATLPDGMTVEPGKGTWFVVTVEGSDPVKVNGQRALDAYVADYREYLVRKAEADAAEDSKESDKDEDDSWLDGEDNEDGEEDFDDFDEDLEGEDKS